MLYLSMPRKTTFSSMITKTLLITLLVITCAIALLLFFRFTHVSVNISGDSMLPIIHNGDRLLMSRLFIKPQIGGIYSVAKGATRANPEIALVKRVIAGPGDVLEFDANTGEWLFYNGINIVVEESNKLPSKLLSSKEPDSYSALLKVSGAFNHLLQLPMYRLLPEQPLHSAKQQLFMNKVRYYPYIQQRALANGRTKVTVPAGHYFVMSDNWSSNLDSRFFGPLPARVFELHFSRKQAPVKT